MKLWCDDIRPAPPGWEWARNVTEAMRKIATSPEIITQISLDNDICGSTEEFIAVAYFLVEFIANHLPERTPKINIHTANPVAMVCMEKVLARHLLEFTRVDCMDIYKGGL